MQSCSRYKTHLSANAVTYRFTAQKLAWYIRSLRRYFAFKISFRAFGDVLRIYICRITNGTPAMALQGRTSEYNVFLVVCALHAITRNNEIVSVGSIVVV